MTLARPLGAATFLAFLLGASGAHAADGVTHVRVEGERGVAVETRPAGGAWSTLCVVPCEFDQTAGWDGDVRVRTPFGPVALAIPSRPGEVVVVRYANGRPGKTLLGVTAGLIGVVGIGFVLVGFVHSLAMGPINWGGCDNDACLKSEDAANANAAATRTQGGHEALTGLAIIGVAGLAALGFGAMKSDSVSVDVPPRTPTWSHAQAPSLAGKGASGTLLRIAF
jgi:hypothetical protein